MKVSIKAGNIFAEKADAVAIPIFQGEKIENILRGAKPILISHANELAKDSGFDGKEDKTLLIQTYGHIPAKTILLMGLGEKKSFKDESLRIASAIAVIKAKDLRADKIAMPAVNASIQTEGALLADYTFHPYKTREKKELLKKNIEELIFVCKQNEKAKTKKDIELGTVMASGANFARDLVNEPAAVVTPKYLADTARKIADASKDISIEIFDKAQCEKLGMGAFLAVAKGTDDPPYFIHLTYKGGTKKIAIIGKGITFDTGGLALKSDRGMAEMKCDMAGAAAVLGIFSQIAQLKPKAEVHGIIAACENMPGPRAMKFGDIIQAMDGTTIEITHPDAEGRLTLADAVLFARKLKPDYIIDLATLTGACLVALGQDIAGLFANSEDLVKMLNDAAEDAGEKVWRLPLEDSYKDLLKSKIADLRNDAAKEGAGAITAALFIAEFVGKTEWAHMDIAGPAFAEKFSTPYIPSGGSGYSVRMIMRLLMGMK